MNKKILAILMALLMVAVSGVAMADGTFETALGTGFFKIKKDYTFNGNTITSNVPKEELTFSASFVEVTQAEEGAGKDTAPTVSITAKAADADAENGVYTVDNAIKVQLPANPKAGVYKYTIKEDDKATLPTNEAAITYSTETFNLYVVVGPANDENGGYAIKTVYVNDGQKKIDEFKFTNVIDPSKLGTVTVEKEITGNLAVLSDVFPVTVTMTSDKPITANVTTISAQNDSTAPNLDGQTQPTAAANFVKTDDKYTSTTTVYVTDGTKLSIANIPTGVQVSISESADDLKVAHRQYEIVANSSTMSGTVSNAPLALKIVNDCSETVDTGVTTDSMPYIMLMAIVAIAAVAFVMKKRAAHE